MNLLKLVAVSLILCLAQACSSDGRSPEDQVRRFVDSAIEAGEGRNTGDLLGLTHVDYSDQQGNNRKRLEGLLRAYFFRHKNIHLFSRIDSIEVLGDNQATVKLHLAMAGTVISDVDALARLSARVYRFELQLVREDDWQLRHATWAPASLGDLQ